MDIGVWGDNFPPPPPPTPSFFFFFFNTCVCIYIEVLILIIWFNKITYKLINALKEVSSPPSSIAAVVYGSLSSSHDFCQVEFSHVHQLGNRPTHLLAKHALSIDDFSVWIEESLYFLEQAFLNDVLMLS